jgi:hypothetical protein
MTPSQGRSGARLDYVKTAAVCGRCRSWQMTFCDTAGSRMPGGAGSALIDCHARQLATGKTLRDQEAPGSIALLHTCAARDDTSVPTVSARAPPAGQVAIHPTPDAIRHEQPLQRKFKERARKRQPPIQRDSNRSRGICQSRWPLHRAVRSQRSTRPHAKSWHVAKSGGRSGTSHDGRRREHLNVRKRSASATADHQRGPSAFGL